MRVCHLDTCPVGVATQNPELRERFNGKPEFVETFFEFIAEEVRELLAALGFRSLGRGDRPRRAARHPRGRSTTGRPAGSTYRRSCTSPSRRFEQDLLLHQARRTTASTRRSTTSSSSTPPPRSSTASRWRSQLPIRNVNRTVGTMLGHEVTKRYGGDGLPDDTIDVTFTGSAGPELRRVRARAASRCGSTATPTTTSARACPAAG